MNNKEQRRIDWEKLMKDYEKHGFIIHAYAGVATVCSHKKQVELNIFDKCQYIAGFCDHPSHDNPHPATPKNDEEAWNSLLIRAKASPFFVPLGNDEHAYIMIFDQKEREPLLKPGENHEYPRNKC